MKKHRLLQELEQELKIVTRGYLLRPKEVRDYLQDLGYSRSYAKKLLYKFGCPRPPVHKVLIEEWVKQRKRRKCRMTRLQRESLRLRRTGLSIREAAVKLGVPHSTVFRAAKRAREIELEPLPYRR